MAVSTGREDNLMRVNEMHIKLLAVAILFAGSSPASAESLSPTAGALFRLAVDEKALETAVARKTLTERVKAYCNEIRSDFPQNSPAEDAWLREELQAGGERGTRIFSSPEWGRRQVKNFTTGCLQGVTVLEKSPENAKAYAGLGYTFVRLGNDSEYYARKNNLHPEKYGFPLVLNIVTQSLLAAALYASD